MTDTSLTQSEFQHIRTTADYQFGSGAGQSLFPDRTELRVRRTRSDRISQVHTEETRLVTQRTDGRFTLSVAAGRRLLAAQAPLNNCVTVGNESVPYVKDGKNAFAKFVTDVDDEVRDGDEVLVVNDDELLGVGRAELSADAMRAFRTGMAVKIREGSG